MKSFLTSAAINFKEHVSLRDLTHMNVSGSLPLVAFPQNIEQLKQIYTQANKRKLQYDVLGSLSNTYLPNNYSRELVIMTTHVKDVKEHPDGGVEVGCGYNLTKIARELSSRGVTGYEGLVGIPGTVGAAAINNSGAFNASMSKVVKSMLVIKPCGEVVSYSNEEIGYATRNSRFKRHPELGLVLAVRLDTTCKEEQARIDARIREFTKIRKEVIDGPRKSLGSVFVATSMREIARHHKFASLAKKIVNQPFKWLLNSNKINTYLDFLFYGKPSLAKHCDSLNRFTWEKDTTEAIFWKYIAFMQKLAHNKLELEIEIRKAKV